MAITHTTLPNKPNRASTAGRHKEWHQNGGIMLAAYMQYNYQQTTMHPPQQLPRLPTAWSVAKLIPWRSPERTPKRPCQWQSAAADLVGLIRVVW